MNIEERIESLLHQMTLREKCALLSGKDSWRTVPIDRLGIQSIVMTDGPHGVRATEEGGRIYASATSFPTGVSLAATWNPALIEQVGEALAEETHALGCDILLGPCVNIVRHPTAGRNFEAYSEDPFLAGKIGSAWVRGLQRKGVGASLKHYACNNQEDDRMRGSSEIDERTLHEIYLAQFEEIVKETNPWTVMCSYNRINGDYASQHYYLLQHVLKGIWGYDGAVISDWGANHTIFESIQGGLDLEMPGPAKYYGRLLEEAVRNWQIELADVDEAVRRILRLLIRAGGIDRSERPAGALNTPEHQGLASRVAQESITLLKNDGNILPLDAKALKSIAVIGPMADYGAIGGGGSSFLEPPHRTTPLQGLRARLDGSVAIHYAQGCDAYSELPVLTAEFVKPLSGEDRGLRGEYFANLEFGGTPVIDRVDQRLGFWWLSFAPLPETPGQFSVRWTGDLSVPVSGRYTFKVQNSGQVRLFLDGKMVIENNIGAISAFPPPQAVAQVELVTGNEYDLKVEYIRTLETDHPAVFVLFAYTPLPEEDDRLAKAVEAARAAEVALVFAGWPEGYESEGHDRPGIELTNRQDELIRAVAAVTPHTVVILNCGSPVAMPWVDEVPGILEAYYPGQEGGHAVASVLVGETNPSGKLTVTFPQRIQDTPAYTHFGSGREVLYGEGIFVGYRYYDQRQVEPLFPFGHGLSYTHFDYQDLQVEVKERNPVRVSVRVANTGNRAGAETIQLYVSDKESSLPRPPKELKGFSKIELQPGESQVVSFDLTSRAFAFYDPQNGDWVVEPGEYEILVGSSSRDIRLKGLVVI
jgi:beta-glucosidase